MKRICLFAGYDSKNIIHDYVVYYLKELSTVADVYYMADNEISEHEKVKITPYVKGAYGFNHKKYDFGSWQELIKIIGWEKISEYDELILANDSVFGPLYPIKELFEKIEKDRQWEVCGITEECYIEKNNDKYSINNFIQSYFVIIKKNIFMQEYIKQFFHDYTLYTSKADVVLNGEKKLSKILIENDVVIKKVIEKLYDPFKEWKSILKSGSPFIKKSKFTNKEYNRKYETLYKYEDIVAKYNTYDIYLIDRYLSSCNISKNNFNNIAYAVVTIIENIKHLRKKIFTVYIKTYRKEIIIFGIPFIRKHYKKSKFEKVNNEVIWIKN